MRSVLIISCLIAFPMHGFMETLKARMLLGSDTLAEVQRVCTTSKNPQEYDALYTKLLNTPPPLIIRALDKLLGESRESRIATLWYETGVALNEVLYSLIYTSLGMAVWDSEDVQTKLRMLYSREEIAEFNRLMGNLKGTHEVISKKLRAKGSWWPMYQYREFKDADIELEVLLRRALETLVDLSALINSLNPDLNTSVFKTFAPSVIKATLRLGAQYRMLSFINQSSITRRYNEMRAKTLEDAIKRCMPPLRPLAAQS